MKTALNKFNKNLVLRGIATILFFFVVMFGAGVKTSDAMFGFGGRIVSVVPCPCSMNLAITIAGIRGGIFSLEPGVLPFAWYQIFRPGPWAKGTYVPGNVCLWPIPYGCAGFPTMGTILEVGTSMF